MPGNGWPRNTPTSVGKTQSATQIPRSAKKHPHERGEDRAGQGQSGGDGETPPRAWGRQPGTLRGLGPHGNTPTSVGKTPIRC